MLFLKPTKAKVYLTELQKRIIDLYCNQRLTQQQVAYKIWGKIDRQPCVSKVLRELSAKTGIPVTKLYRYNDIKKYEIIFKEID